jgi:hypothetical protein
MFGTRRFMPGVVKRALVLLIAVVALSLITEAALDGGEKTSSDRKVGVMASVFDPFKMVRVPLLTGRETEIPHFKRPNIKIPQRPLPRSTCVPGLSHLGSLAFYPANGDPTWKPGRALWMSGN